MEMKWFQDQENVIEVYRWAMRHDHIKTAQDGFYLITKPWKFEWIWEKFLTEEEAPDANYTCEKCGGKGTVDTDDAVQNCHLYTITCPDCQGSGMDQPTEEQLGLDDPADWAKREPSDGEPFLEEDVEERPSDLIWKEELIVP